MPDEVQNQPSPASFNADVDASHLITDQPTDSHARLMGELDIKPHEQLKLSLGKFSPDNQPAGFSVELTPDPDPAESIVTRITSLGDTRQYELVMHIENYGNHTVQAQIWQL